MVLHVLVVMQTARYVLQQRDVLSVMKDSIFRHTSVRHVNQNAQHAEMVQIVSSVYYPTTTMTKHQQYVHSVLAIAYSVLVIVVRYVKPIIQLSTDNVQGYHQPYRDACTMNKTHVGNVIVGIICR